jgi:hypothetical protein
VYYNIPNDTAVFKELEVPKNSNVAKSSEEKNDENAKDNRE